MTRPHLVVRYHESFGRCGSLSEIFVATALELRALKAAGEAYRGEVLGKHSEVTSTLDDETLEVVADDEAFVTKALELGVLDSGELWETLAEQIAEQGPSEVLGEGFTADEVAALAEAWSFTVPAAA